MSFFRAQDHPPISLALDDPMMTAVSNIKYNVGTAEWTLDAANLQRQNDLLTKIFELNLNGLDSGPLYGNGGCEQFIGRSGALKHLQITSKVPGGYLPGGSTPEAVSKFLDGTLKSLGVEKIPIYLIHAPDDSVPVSETLDALQEHYKQGKFEELGLSNFTAEQTREAYEYCKAKGYILPTVYQLMYSLVSRNSEAELFPTLRELGFVVQVYSPIAGGFLAKTSEDIRAGKGKWTKTTFLGQLLHQSYNKPELLEYLDKFNDLATEAGVSKVELAYRWVRWHSALRDGDTLILGASNAKQLEETVRQLGKGPLEDWIVERLATMWKSISAHANDNFYRSYVELLRAGSSGEMTV
ncbi:NADP-dependent oxidoreductase domain-containing protein [Stachybotrys elegans]|uniref:NADP-dependent oxidoreductase domain-containing protein n=1 Tax=Stachybotrys elegans TaxID=80388 RepID=A0A8K0SHX2_9HYPO|nr:NADP-dependent oxidoreductase domain-containing protein [Stachybotrys elegans]